MDSMSTKAVWVMGCMRSGTTWTANILRPFVEKVYIEPRKYKPVEERKVLHKHKSFGFKFCEDKRHCDRLVELFPNSKFLLMNRDGREIVSSIATPSGRSVPVRRSAGLTIIAEQRGVTRFQLAIEIWLSYLGNYPDVLKNHGNRTLLVEYRELVLNFEKEYTKIARYIDFEGPIDFDAVPKPFKSPNQYGWERWTQEQTKFFKDFPGANEALILYGHVKDLNW